MTRATFFKHFELLAEQPDAVAKMREFVFQLAIQGRLVPQDRNDEPVSELLKRIRAAMESFTKEGKNGRKRRASSDDETPFKVPATWEWVRFGDVVRIRTGKLDANAAVENGAYPFFTCSQTPSRIATYSFDTSAVLLAGNGDFNLKYYVGKFDAYQRTYVIEPLEWDLRFCFILMSSQFSRITENNRGSAIPYLKLGDIADPVVPLPPLAEQRRIVAKVDELMALCDELEQRQQARQHARAHLTQSAYHHLTAAKDPVEFRHRFNFILHNSSFILEDVPQLRQAILQLAVQGRLVPQNPKDEPAGMLHQRICSARKRLADAGKIKGRVEIPPVDPAEAPYPIPGNWLWLPLNEITELAYGKLLPTKELLSEGFDVFGANGVIGKYSRYHYEDEMLLISCRGAYSGKPNISPRKCYVTNNSIVCEFFDPALCDIRFFHAVIAVSPREKIVTGTAQPQVTVANAIKLPVPLPPLAEQKRIVARVEELLRSCDTLEAQLHQTRTLGSHLLASTLHHLLAA
jgi:type I restriction enzyme S subunit